MNFNLKVTGVSEVVGGLESFRSNVINNLEPVMKESYKRYQQGAAARAPVKTGALKASLTDDRYTTMQKSENSISIIQREGVDYALIQERTNPNGKEHFMGDSIIEEVPKLREALEEYFKNGVDL